MPHDIYDDHGNKIGSIKTQEEKDREAAMAAALASVAWDTVKDKEGCQSIIELPIKFIAIMAIFYGSIFIWPIFAYIYFIAPNKNHELKYKSIVKLGVFIGVLSTPFLIMSLLAR